MDSKKISFYSGLTVIVGTHVYMLMKTMPPEQQKAHAILNLVAGGLVYYAFV